MMKKILIGLFLLITFSLTGAGLYIKSLYEVKYTGSEAIFVVENGDTFGKINQRLFNQGIISNTRLFHYLGKYKKALTKFRAGSYNIPHGATMPEVLDILVYGQAILHSLTIPEGKNMYEIAKLLEAAKITTETDFLGVVKNPEFISQLGINAPSLEGYLYPETYRFAPQTSARIVAKTMVDLFNKKVRELNFNHPFLDKHQVIILASMVEKETGAKAERPAIAGVFTNRLKKKMRLESDPTTIYGIWERYTGNIKKSDLLEVTPYNTYKIPALPLGPISNPSLAAIEAVLNPESHEFLFFVSKNDGTHIFTKNYGDHRSAVDNFQKNSKAREGKSWRNLKQ
jgi:UPF0755 protein